MKKIEVENNIKIAETLPSSFYKSEVLFDELKEKVFYKSWQLIDHESVLPVNTNAYPFDFIKDYINEPLVLIKDDNNDFKCLTNVCTHRANIIINDRCKINDLRCMYHGRKFYLDGKV
jgi:choline monooxygenase